MVKKIILLRGVGTIYKTLFTDGVEFLEIADWKLNVFSNFEENTNLLFNNYFIKSIKQNNQYFIEMNSNSFTLVKTDTCTLDHSNNVIDYPKQTTIGDILIMTSNIEFLNIYYIVIGHELLKIQ